jgi:hypothetical protein
MAEKAGAIAALIMDNSESTEYLVDMIDDNTNRRTEIPSAFLVWKDGYTLSKFKITLKNHFNQSVFVYFF